VRAIARHDIDGDFAAVRASEAAEDLPDFIELAKRKPSAIRSVMQVSLDEAELHCATDPEAAWIDTWDAFARALQAGSAVFVVASQSEGEVEFRLDDEVVRVAAAGSSLQNDPLTWLDALYLAMIFRDQDRINFLARVPVDLLRGSGVDYDEYVYSVVRMWQGYWTGAADVVDLVLEAMRAADPDSVTHSTPQSVLQIHFPIIETFYQFILRDEAKFNEALGNALTLHREFWTKDEASARSPRGFVALGLLALAGHAKDMGLTIDVVSEYLPEIMLYGNRLGERTL
jgi:hypothetical protein